MIRRFKRTSLEDVGLTLRSAEVLWDHSSCFLAKDSRFPFRLHACGLFLLAIK